MSNLIVYMQDGREVKCRTSGGVWTVQDRELKRAGGRGAFMRVGRWSVATNDDTVFAACQEYEDEGGGAKDEWKNPEYRASFRRDRLGQLRRIREALRAVGHPKADAIIEACNKEEEDWE